MAVAAALSVCAACTSSGGTLPETSPAPTASVQAGATASKALLNSAILPAGYRDGSLDVGNRWGEIIDESRDAESLRPGCQEPLAAVSAQLHEQAEQTAGAKFSNGRGSDIRQFVAVLPTGLGPTLVAEVRKAYAHCDSFAVTTPEGGSIDLTVELIMPAGVNAAGTEFAVWKRTLISSVIRRVEYRAVYANTTVAGAIAFDGDPTLSEVSAVMQSAAGQAARAIS